MARRRHLCLARDDQRPGDHRPDDASLARAGNVEALERRVVPDVVGRIAVRNLPDDLALVQIDRADAPVRRLHDRQALARESWTPSLAAAAGPAPSRRSRGIWRIARRG